MKTVRYTLCTLLTFAFSLQAAIADVTAGEFNLPEHKGYVVYLDFWASWCGPCVASFPWLNQLKTDLEGSGLRVISVNLDANHDDATAFLQKFPASFKVLFDPDGRLAKQYQVEGMPSSYLFDRDGNLVARHIGFTLRDQSKLRNLVESTLKE